MEESPRLASIKAGILSSVLNTRNTDLIKLTLTIAGEDPTSAYSVLPRPNWSRKPRHNKWEELFGDQPMVGAYPQPPIKEAKPETGHGEENEVTLPPEGPPEESEEIGKGIESLETMEEISEESELLQSLESKIEAKLEDLLHPDLEDALADEPIELGQEPLTNEPEEFVLVDLVHPEAEVVTGEWGDAPSHPVSHELPEIELIDLRVSYTGDPDEVESTETESTEK